MNERELRLLYSIREIVRAIHQGIHAIYEQKRSESNDKRPPIKLDISSEVCLPVTVSKYYASEQSEGQKDRRRDRIRLGLETAALVAAMLAGVFTYRTLRQVQRQADASESQVAAMQKQLEAMDRPWIKCETTIVTPLSYDDIGMHLGVSFMVTNVGKSPAQNVGIRAVLFPTFRGRGIEEEANLEREKELCARPHLTIPGEVIFPGEGPHVFTQMLQSPKKDALLIGVGGDLTDFLFVNLVACIDYTFGASPKHHQTAFTLQVRMSDGRVISASKTPIPASSLALLPFFIGTSYVN